MGAPVENEDIYGGPELVSIVVPAMNEESNLSKLYEEVHSELRNENWELIFVDDGSTDRTYQEIIALSEKDARVRGLSLSRNFGHQYALLAGLRAAKGDVVISMDADLQHPPSVIPELLNHWRDGCKIVHTQRYSEGEIGWFKRKSSDWFYRFLSFLSGIEIQEGQSDFRLLDRQVVGTLAAMEEADLFLRGMVHWVGFRSATVPYRVRVRNAGVSKYGLVRMLMFATSGITSISTLPLRLGILAGFITSILAFLQIVYVLWAKYQGNTVAGWASILGLVALLFGINFILMGFLGIYIGHIFNRVQNHPPYIVESRTEEPGDIGREREAP